MSNDFSTVELPDAVLAKREELVRGHDVLDQAISWNLETWTNSIPAEHHKFLDELSSDCKSDEQGRPAITRHQVFELRDNDPRQLFLAAMIWGYGTTGYGASRVAKIIRKNANTLNDYLKGQVQAARSRPEESWSSFRNEHRLKWFGPAFASKFAYFVAFESSDSELRPLIVDINTSWVMWDLVKLQRTVELKSTYVQYVDMAHRWAEEQGWRADEVEWALFELGKTVEKRKSRTKGYQTVKAYRLTPCSARSGPALSLDSHTV